MKNPVNINLITSKNSSRKKELINSFDFSNRKLKLQNKALLEHDIFLNQIINNVGSPIFVKDDKSRILIANDAFCIMFNLNREMVIGKTLAENVPKNEREHFLEVDKQVITDGIKNVCEETLTIEGHPSRTIITTKTRYTDAKGKHYIIGVITDITERKNLELKLDYKANTDYLTGVNNRGHFMEIAELELLRSLRHNTPLSLLMLDIDFFKQINDAHGHKAGDTVLKNLANVCKETFRETDIIGRVGGEEFAVLLPETNLEEALDVARRLLAVLENQKIWLEKFSLPINFTVSIGLTALFSDELSLDDLLVLSDKALYQAKNSGRNKICTVLEL